MLLRFWVLALLLVPLFSLSLVNCTLPETLNTRNPLSNTKSDTTLVSMPLVGNIANVINPNSKVPMHLVIARKYIGVKEKTGKNDGPEIKMFLQSVGRVEGNAYCAAYGSFSLTEANKLSPIKSPTIRSGLAQDFKRDKNVVEASQILAGLNKVKIGDILIFGKGTTIYGHFAFANENWDGIRGRTIEANTSSGNSGSQSDGDGVYLRTRSISKTAYFRIRWKVPVIYL